MKQAMVFNKKRSFLVLVFLALGAIGVAFLLSTSGTPRAPIPQREVLAKPKTPTSRVSPKKTKKAKIVLRTRKTRVEVPPFTPNSVSLKAEKVLESKEAHLNSSDLAHATPENLLELSIYGLPKGENLTIESLSADLGLTEDYELIHKIERILTQAQKDAKRSRDAYYKMVGEYALKVLKGKATGFFNQRPINYNGRIVYAETSDRNFSGRIYIRECDSPPIFQALDKYRLAAGAAWSRIRGLILKSLEKRKKSKKSGR